MTAAIVLLAAAVALLAAALVILALAVRQGVATVGTLRRELRALREDLDQRILLCDTAINQLDGRLAALEIETGFQQGGWS